MPWNKQDYPPSMKNLEERVRNKAIEIANALLSNGYEEGRAIAIATAQAEEWNRNHPAHETDEPIHVVPHEEGWAIKEQGRDHPSSVHHTKTEAVQAAKCWSADQSIRVIIHDQHGRIQESRHFSK
ncbi:DUF2188 domain-containing protein [Paenibacillus massiliensis]|uniref:DUF2188 domain-containing protein n=1 Tax=Paenibacillus massiliensis TaxID=225917 RepID=UPI00036A4A14|nr:DUF2188 domain-containing protein [Paenibacillus massiliensis]